MAAALPSLLLNEKKAAKERNARTAAVSSVCAVFQIHKTDILGTFKFIVKFVVCIIIAQTCRS